MRTFVHALRDAAIDSKLSSLARVGLTLEWSFPTKRNASPSRIISGSRSSSGGMACYRDILVLELRQSDSGLPTNEIVAKRSAVLNFSFPMWVSRVTLHA
jgi:hypothetical protein